MSQDMDFTGGRFSGVGLGQAFQLIVAPGIVRMVGR